DLRGLVGLGLAPGARDTARGDPPAPAAAPSADRRAARHNRPAGTDPDDSKESLTDYDAPRPRQRPPDGLGGLPVPPGADGPQIRPAKSVRAPNESEPPIDFL